MSSSALLLYRPQPWFVPKSNYKVPTETFHRFKELPAEIRVKIWNFMLPGPRLVDFRWRGGVCGSHRILGQDANGLTGYWTSSVPVPIVLHISMESRLEGLRTYDLIHLGETCKKIINPQLQGEHRVRRLQLSPRIALDRKRDTTITFQVPVSITAADVQGTRRIVRVEPRNCLFLRHAKVTVCPFKPRRRNTLYYANIVLNSAINHRLEHLTIALYRQGDCLDELNDDEVKSFEIGFSVFWNVYKQKLPYQSLLTFDVKRLEQFPPENRAMIKDAMRTQVKAWELQLAKLKREVSKRRRNAQAVVDRLWWYPDGEARPPSYPEDRKQLLLPWHSEQSRFHPISTARQRKVRTDQHPKPGQPKPKWRCP